MQFTATVVDHGDDSLRTLVFDERRREARTPFGGRATIVRCSDRTSAVVLIRDLSSGGIGIAHKVRLAAGERFILVLPSSLAHIARAVLCVVVNSCPSVNGGFNIGAKFSALIHRTSVSQPGQRAPAATPPSLAVGEVIRSFEARPDGKATKAEVAGLGSLDAVTGKTKAPIPRPAGQIMQLLTREDCIKRAEQAMQARTLSGVVAQVITLATSPRSDMSELAALVVRDPMLSARILQAANSVSFTSTRGVVSTIPEAVRNIGCAAVRDIASTLGVFDAMPASTADGFNPIRCWQHSFAVATLCQRLADETNSGLAYLVGLCHDLGEILFHGHFGGEYQQVIETQAATGKRRDELERQMLGMSHGELVMTILRCLGLPESISAPIEEFHAGFMTGRSMSNPLARVLRLAEFYANGALLASSGDSPLCALSRPECRNATGKEEPNRPDVLSLRGEILGLTVMLARLSPKEEQELMTPLYRPSSVKLMLVRDPSLSPFDPIHAGLEALSDVVLLHTLPSPQQMAGVNGVIVAARSTSAAGFTGPEITKSIGDALPVLWLIGRVDGGATVGSVVPTAWPVRLSHFADFIQSLSRPETNSGNP